MFEGPGFHTVLLTKCNRSFDSSEKGSGLRTPGFDSAIMSGAARPAADADAGVGMWVKVRAL